MRIEEVQSKVLEIATELCEILPDEADKEYALYSDWGSLGSELAGIARQCMLTGCRIAAYAGIAAKKARKGEWCGYDEKGEWCNYDKNGTRI